MATQDPPGGIKPGFPAPDQHLDQGRVLLKPGAKPIHRGRGPKGYQRSDERINEDISERLLHAPRIDSSNVSIRVENATIYLSGTVPERWMKYTIEDLAHDTLGVRDVINEIRVPREPGS